MLVTARLSLRALGALTELWESRRDFFVFRNEDLLRLLRPAILQMVRHFESFEMLSHTQRSRTVT